MIHTDTMSAVMLIFPIHEHLINAHSVPSADDYEPKNPADRTTAEVDDCGHFQWKRKFYLHVESTTRQHDVHQNTHNVRLSRTTTQRRTTQSHLPPLFHHSHTTYEAPTPFTLPQKMIDRGKASHLQTGRTAH